MYAHQNGNSAPSPPPPPPYSQHMALSAAPTLGFQTPTPGPDTYTTPSSQTLGSSPGSPAQPFGASGAISNNVHTSPLTDDSSRLSVPSPTHSPRPVDQEQQQQHTANQHPAQCSNLTNQVPQGQSSNQEVPVRSPVQITVNNDSIPGEEVTTAIQLPQRLVLPHNTVGCQSRRDIVRQKDI